MDFSDSTWANERCWTPDDGLPFNESKAFQNGIAEKDTETAVEQFWK